MTRGQEERVACRKRRYGEDRDHVFKRNGPRGVQKGLVDAKKVGTVGKERDLTSDFAQNKGFQFEVSCLFVPTACIHQPSSV